MDSGIQNIIAGISSGDNTQRQAMEQTMKEKRAANGQELLTHLTQFVLEKGSVEGPDQEQATLAALLLKKQFLDDRKEEEGLWQVNKDQIAELKTTMSQSLNFKVQSKQLLKRKADLICKCYRKLESYDEMISGLKALFEITDGAEDENMKRKVFGLYNFEILSEYHLEDSSMLLQHFPSAVLQDSNNQVKVAGLKAISAILSSIDDEDVVLKYKGEMEGILNVVIDVLKNDET